MSTTYYGVCWDCFEKIDLDKFYSFCPYEAEEFANIEQEDLKEFATEGYAYRSLRLHFFMSQHQRHRLSVESEHIAAIEEFKQVFPWPRRGGGATEFFDFSDPKAERLIVTTKYGAFCVDIRQDGVNVWRMLRGSGRADTLIIPAAQGSLAPWEEISRKLEGK